MKDGYYLSAYVNPVGLQRVLNVTYRHDANLSLWHKQGSRVSLLAHWEVERLSGQKQHRTPFLDQAHLEEFVDARLAEHGLSRADMTEIWGTPGLDTVDDYHLGAEHPELAYHSLAHLYSAVLLDSDTFFDDTVLGFAVDRGPDFVVERAITSKWFTGCVVREGEMTVFPVQSPGPLYGAAKDRFHQREGTLMALAGATKAYGRCDREAILDGYTFDDITSMTRPAAALDEIAGQVRDTLVSDPRFTEEESFAGAVMKEVQAISVRIMERNVEDALARHELAPADTVLALAGGYALNCPTNSHLMDKYGFRRLVAPPCVGDDGQSIGMALAAFRKKSRGRRFDFRFPTPYLGGSDTDLDGALADHAHFIASVGEIDLATAVRDLREGPLVWFHGRSEIGPRALGNRSLLADPTSYAAKEELNRLKERQWWRPVAPVVLAEHLPAWFENSRPSPYMLETFTIRGALRDRIPAVAHLDHSARVQSVTVDQNPALHALLAAFHEATGVPMLCNTSLNDRGEPIVERLAEAFNFCLRKGIRIGYFNGVRVEFTHFDAYRVPGPLPRDHERFTTVPAERERAIRAALNPHGLPDLVLYRYLHDNLMMDGLDIREAEGARAVAAAVAAQLAETPTLREYSENRMRERGEKFASLGAAYSF
ncbi:carbamoyltransferase C-terminal domain-containing protein (plasmid) [Streptomyces xanthophaeus]|uniref:carbamoyltransferase C-terminal domain-containing protein n=1 Tax=Streptomyces xanthophaeus TaxID=67385 RepID=UPI00399014D4